MSHEGPLTKCGQGQAGNNGKALKKVTEAMYKLERQVEKANSSIQRKDLNRRRLPSRSCGLCRRALGTYHPVGLGETGKKCPHSLSLSVLLVHLACGGHLSTGTGSQGTEQVKKEGGGCAGAGRRASTLPLFENGCFIIIQVS